MRDETVYLSDYLSGAALDERNRRRTADLASVRTALVRGIDDISLISQGPYPDTFDIDAAVELCWRGFRELSLAVAA